MYIDMWLPRTGHKPKKDSKHTHYLPLVVPHLSFLFVIICTSPRLLRAVPCDFGISGVFSYTFYKEGDNPYIDNLEA